MGLQWIDLETHVYLHLWDAYACKQSKTFMLHIHVKHFWFYSDSHGPLHSNDFSTELFWPVSLSFLIN